MPPNDIPIFQPLTGVYEASGIQQLADGRFIVIEDEEKHALCAQLAEHRCRPHQVHGPGGTILVVGRWRLLEA